MEKLTKDFKDNIMNQSMELLIKRVITSKYRRVILFHLLISISDKCTCLIFFCFYFYLFFLKNINELINFYVHRCKRTTFGPGGGGGVKIVNKPFEVSTQYPMYNIKMG